MHPAVAPAALTLGATLALFGYIAASRERSALRASLLALLSALALWSLGSLLRFSASTPAGVQAALHVMFLGSCMSPPLWFLTTREIDRPGRGLGRSVLLLVPSALTYLAFLTNDSHGLVMRDPDPAALARGAIAWAGPVYWAFVAYAYGVVISGTALQLRSSGPLLSRRENRRGRILAAAAAIPLVGSSAYLFQWVQISFDPTPALLGISVLLISLAVVRYELLERLPLARRDVIEHLDQGVLLAGGLGEILDANPAAAELLGRGRRSLLGRNLAQVLADLGAGGGGEQASRIAALAEARDPARLELVGASGRRIEARVAAVLSPDGQLAGRFAVLRDRTEERRGELEGRHAQMLESLGTLAAGIAHEVNNPLAYIRANLTQIQRMGEEVEASSAAGEDGGKLRSGLLDLREIAEETLDGIERIGRIVADIRTMGGVSRNEVFGELSLNQVVGDALRLSNLHRDPAIRLTTRLVDPLPPVEGSAPRLVQAVLNLLLNARQALVGSASPEISLETRAEPAYVEIRVRDNGPGISTELERRIFDTFFTTKGPGRGTGLGLSISLDIARDHGGSLRLESAPGQGACFALRLPRRPGDVGGQAAGR